MGWVSGTGHCSGDLRAGLLVRARIAPGECYDVRCARDQHWAGLVKVIEQHEVVTFVCKLFGTFHLSRTDLDTLVCAMAHLTMLRVV